MHDGFMEYMLLFDDDEEDEPKPGEKSGCGCLSGLFFCLLAGIVLRIVSH